MPITRTNAARALISGGAKGRAAAAASPNPSEDPPTSVRLFKYGKVDTTKGEFLFDEKAAASVMKEWKAYGNDLCFDWEHKAVDPNARPGDGKAAGWFQLALKNDGLYAVGIKWTEEAAEAITKKHFRFFSPTFDYEKKTGRILALLNVALTNIPATKNLPALVAASNAKPGRARANATVPIARLGTKPNRLARKEGKNNMAAKAKTSLGKKTTKKTVTEVTEDVPETTDDGSELDDVEMDDDGDAATDDVEMDDDGDAATDDAEMDDDGDAATDDDGDDDGDAATDDDGDDDGSDDDSDGKKAPPPVANKKTKKTARTAKNARVKPAERAPKAARAVTGRKTSDMAALGRAALEITGKANTSEALGVLKGLAMSKAHTETLSRQVAQMQRDATRTKVKGLVEKAIKAGKLTPAQREQFVKLGMRDPKELTALLETMPTRVVMEGAGHTAGGSAASASLSREEMKLAKQLGTFDAYVKAKSEGKLLPLDYSPEEV